jgi:3-hydroxyisobutyrate dehydrogenase-like beta-hydroxyacid dehydrogenase
MVRGRYTPPMITLDVWKKDMTVIADFAREIGCPTPLFAATAALYTAATAMGRGKEDTAAVCAVLETLANHRRPKTRRGARR